jgi:hypothetical protein
MQPEQEILSYEPPSIVEIGSIADLTQGGSGTPSVDGVTSV